jgi:hypothetical protein
MYELTESDVLYIFETLYKNESERELRLVELLVQQQSLLNRKNVIIEKLEKNNSLLSAENKEIMINGTELKKVTDEYAQLKKRYKKLKNHYDRIKNPLYLIGYSIRRITRKASNKNSKKAEGL